MSALSTSINDKILLNGGKENTLMNALFTNYFSHAWSSHTI